MGETSAAHSNPRSSSISSRRIAIKMRPTRSRPPLHRISSGRTPGATGEERGRLCCYTLDRHGEASARISPGGLPRFADTTTFPWHGIAQFPGLRGGLGSWVCRRSERTWSTANHPPTTSATSRLGRVHAPPGLRCTCRPLHVSRPDASHSRPGCASSRRRHRFHR